MATSAVISVRKAKRVVLKIIAFNTGIEVLKVVSEIRELGRVPTMHEAYLICFKNNLGIDASRIIMDERQAFHGRESALPPIYRESFRKSKFDPRWRSGLDQFTRVIDFE